MDIWLTPSRLWGYYRCEDIVLKRQMWVENPNEMKKLGDKPGIGANMRIDT